MTAARRTRTRARCNMVLVVFLNCNTRSFNNQVNKIFVEHFTWFSSYLYFFTFLFFCQISQLHRIDQPSYLFVKLTSNKLFGFIYFRYFRSVLHRLGLGLVSPEHLFLMICKNLPAEFATPLPPSPAKTFHTKGKERPSRAEVPTVAHGLGQASTGFWSS